MKTANFWETTASRANTNWIQQLPNEANIVIIGAGGAGLTSAITLGLTGISDIVVLDIMPPGMRGAKKGLGTSLVFDKPISFFSDFGYSYEKIIKYFKMNLIGMENANEFIHTFGKAINNDEEWCRYSKYGGIHLAQEEKDISELSIISKALEILKVQATLLQPPSIQKIADVSTNLVGLFLPNECMMNPALYYNGLYQACKKLDISVFSGFVAENVTMDAKSNWIILDSYGNYIKSKILIICSGANTKALPLVDDLTSFIKTKRIIYGATEVLSSKRLSPYILSTVDGKFSCRRYDNRIIFSFDDNDEYCGDLKQPQDFRIRKAQNLLQKYLTNGESVKLEYVWTKNILLTKDSLPIISEVPKNKNLFLNIGYGTNNISWQHIGAAVLKKLLLESTRKDDGTELFSLSRINNNERV